MTDTIVEKIRKLRDKAQGTEGPESASFWAKVNELMAEHHVTQDQLDVEAKIDLGAGIVKITAINAWREDLLGEISELCGCACSFSRSQKTVMLTGRQFAIESAVETFGFIEKQILIIARRLYPGKAQKERRRAEKGLAMRVCIKIRDSRRYDLSRQLPVSQAFEEARIFMHDLADVSIETDEQLAARIKREKKHISKEMAVGYGHGDMVKLRGEVK